ncbi:MAG: COR domain-containing protein [Candidatus Marithrix sp.]
MFEILKKLFKSDLYTIKQLEQKLGKKLCRITHIAGKIILNNDKKIVNYELNELLRSEEGYVLDAHNKIIGLTLFRHNLNKLPEEIGKLQNLTHLSLCENQLSSLPMWIEKLQNLTKLDLNNNQLIDLPPSIIKLQNLTRLSLYENQLNQCPQVLLDLNLDIKWAEYGDGIHIKDNPFQTPPVEIVKQGRQAIIDYYVALEEQERPLNESKLILIGDGGAGKTSLMKRLLKQEFNPQESQTHGININTLTINDIKFHCWDFGGQQIMHATHQFFLSKRSLYLLVLDSRRETQVDYWLKHIQTFGHNAPVIIVINKIDENPHFDLLQQQLKQNYPNLKHICRISCATQQGIDQLNQTIQATLPDIELLNTMFPAKWFNVKTAITDQAKTTNFTSYEHYVDICQTNGITKESEQTTLINFLHDLGIINHFQDRWLRETNVINPQWLTEAVYTIINAPQLAGNGKLHRDQLTTLLDNNIYPQRKHDYIIELMKKFELCYAINDNEYLLPDLFPSQEPNFTFNPELHFILEYDFLPKSIFTRFIVKMHHDILDNTYWRNGILLKDGNSTALIESNSNQLILQFAGQQKREYLAILLFIIKDINRNFHNLTVTEKIGLPDNLTVNHIYLQKLAQNGQQEYIPPENPEKSYNIANLLGLVAPPSTNEAMLQKILQILEAQGIEQEKDLLDHIDEVVKVNPGMFGMSIDVNALVRKLRRNYKENKL